MEALLLDSPPLVVLAALFVNIELLLAAGKLGRAAWGWEQRGRREQRGGSPVSLFLPLVVLAALFVNIELLLAVGKLERAA